MPWWVAGAAGVVLVAAVASRFVGEGRDSAREVHGAAPRAEETRAGDPRVARTPFRRPLARSEYAILVRPSAAELDDALDRAKLAARLDVPECGGACDVVRAFVKDSVGFTLERQPTDDYILPPEDTWDVVARTLSASERASLHERTVALVVHARETGGDAAPKHVVARAALAAASVLATTWDGIVYDETLRRFESAESLAGRAIRAPLGAPAFTPAHIVLQSFEEDGHVRLLTLGMNRFGAPDVTMRGLTSRSADAAANLLNATAARFAAGVSSLPVTVTPNDLGEVSGFVPRGGSSIDLDGFVPARVAGDPDNLLIELVPPGGPGPGQWDRALAVLTAEADVQTRGDDPKLAAIAKAARESLPRARAEAARDAGTLFVKGPFPYDGGQEFMWIKARRCDAHGCVGVMTNEPSYATWLHENDDAGVQTEEVVDWLLVLPDGGDVGGASIEELEGRR